MRAPALLAATLGALGMAGIGAQEAAETAWPVTARPKTGTDVLPAPRQTHHGWPGSGRGTPRRRRLGRSRRSRVARIRRRKAARR